MGINNNFVRFFVLFKEMQKLKPIIIAIVLLIIIIPIGFYSKLYAGLGNEWVDNKLGGVFYEIFWCLVLYTIFLKVKPFKIAVWVFVITCILEFAQLLNNGFLDLIRSNFIGQAIIGNSFSWSDFPYYVIGSVLGYLFLRIVEKFK